MMAEVEKTLRNIGNEMHTITKKKRNWIGVIDMRWKWLEDSEENSV
jgi:hypothetical protein